MAYFPYTRFDFSSSVNYYSPLTFDYSDTSKVKVIISDADGKSEKLTYGTDYTLESSRIKINSPSTLGSKYSMTITKLFAIRMNGATATPEFDYGIYLDVKKVQSALESMALQVAELQMISENTVKLSYEEWQDTYDNPLILIPTKSGRANKVFSFDSNGNVVMKTPSDFIPELEQIIQSINASKTAAASSASAAATSETNAKNSEDNAKASEVASKASETNAKASETASATSEAKAKSSEDNTLAYKDTAKSYMDTAETYKDMAVASASAAATSETNAAASAAAAAESADRIDADEFYTKTEVDDKLANVETNLPLEMNIEGQLCYVIE